MYHQMNETEMNLANEIKEHISDLQDIITDFKKEIQRAEYVLRADTATLEVQTRDNMVFDDSSHHQIMENIEDTFEKELADLNCIYDRFERKAGRQADIFDMLSDKLESMDEAFGIQQKENLEKIKQVHSEVQKNATSAIENILREIKQSSASIMEDVNTCYNKGNDNPMQYGKLIDDAVKAFGVRISYGLDSAQYRISKEELSKDRELKIARESDGRQDISDKSKLCNCLREMYKAKDALILATNNIVTESVRDSADMIQEMNEISIQIQQAIMQAQENILQSNVARAVSRDEKTGDTGKDINSELTW